MPGEIAGTLHSYYFQLYNFELASFTEALRALKRNGSGHAVLDEPRRGVRR